MGRKKLTAGRDPNLPLICDVCGDLARGYNFTVMSCVSCKSFFRRHGMVNPEQCECRYDGKCTITKVTRADCLSCRLKKCLRAGMDPLMIRGPSGVLVKSNKSQVLLPSPQPLSLLRNDRSHLTTDQWNLLSNIIHAYDDQNIIQRIRCLLDEKSLVPPKLRLKPTEIFALFSSAFMTIQPLVERASHFQNLSSHAQRAVVRHNLFLTGSVNGCFVSREIDAFNHTTFSTVATALYGQEHTRNCVQDNARMERNNSLMKVLLFVLLFSSNCSIVAPTGNDEIETESSALDLLRVQDIYVTMLWKYLVHLYGCDEAVVRYSSLIRSVLVVYRRTEDALKTLSYTKFAEEISVRTEQVLTIED